MASSQNWRIIVVTCSNVESAFAIQKELEIRQQKGSIPKETTVLAVVDPIPLIGSGGATLNALLLVAQHLSIKAGLQAIDPDVLDDARILIMHMGRQSALSPCGSAFVTLPIQLKSREKAEIVQSDVCCNIDLLLFTLSNIVCVGSSPGVWVTSCDMILSVPEKIDIDWSDCVGVHVISVPASPEYAKKHGIIETDDEGTIENIFYLPTEEELKKCQLDDGNIPVLPVIIFLPQEASKHFLLLYTVPPLNGCTFIGLDSGAQPIAISFLFDILLCMAKNVTKEEFVSGERSTSYGGSKNKIHTNHQTPVSRYYMKNAREALWKKLRNIPLKIIFLKNATYNFLFPNGTCYRETVRKLSESNLPNNITTEYFTSRTSGNHDRSANMDSQAAVGNETVALNSIINGDTTIGNDSVIMHCNLQGNFTIESECFLTGLDKWLEFRGKGLIIPHKTVVQGIRLKETSDAVQEGNCIVTIAFGIDDNLTAPYNQTGSSFCNKSWNELFQRTGIESTDLWTEDPLTKTPCLLSARLFPISDTSEDRCGESGILWWLLDCPIDNIDCYPQWRNSKRLSIEEIMGLVSFSREFSWRRNIFFKIGSSKIKNLVSKGSAPCIHPFLSSCVKEGFHKEILSVLDEAACRLDRPSEVARTLSHIADVLGIMAGPEGGLRSGPAKNPVWTKAMDLLEAGKLTDGVKELALQRKQWMGSSLMITRCARHYEGAEQMLIRQAVLHTKQLVDIHNDANNLPCRIGQWVTVEAPCRIDLAGGWSDTPPITYEHGGTVTNVAIKLDGSKPIGAKIRKIPELKLVLVFGHGDQQLHLNCTTFEDIRDFSNPSAPGALLKSVFLCTNTISLSSVSSLTTQLQERHGCGFELHTWSHLPHGSGLGTSSILAGVTCAAVLRILGRNHDNKTLVHLVIHVEQMLTSGGGWQDQVGGLLPGVKMTTSAPEIPIMVKPKQLNLSNDTLCKVVHHTVLIYTGRTRLAKYILQNVIRQWYARFPEILKNVDELTKNAEVCATAWEQGNLEMMCHCLNEYRKQKKIMAPTCEPDEITEIIEAIQPQIHACCLAGAGGGGFLYVITRKPDIHDDLREVLKGLNKEKYTVHQVEVDNEGLTVQVME